MMTVETLSAGSTSTEAAISLTDRAVERVRGLMDERKLEDHALRVFISGGGCSGLQYGMALESAPRETDHSFTFNGVPVVVDPQSMEFLSGATIDYIEDLMGGGFKIENPNAISTCGCGHSFKTSSEGGGHQHDGGCNC
jgi:iron-sulfur cluster assembly accessory protein